MSRVTLAAVGISIAGVAISIYLTVLHFQGVTPACVTSGPINCEAVLASPYAVIAGTSVPTSVLGIVWFAISAGVWTRPRGWLRLAWSGLGLGTVLVLVFIEIVLVGAICLWCTAAHVLVIALVLGAVTVRGR